MYKLAEGSTPQPSSLRSHHHLSNTGTEGNYRSSKIIAYPRHLDQTNERKTKAYCEEPNVY